jgi:nucleoside-diphosphate-sugar epimerase
MTTLFVSGPTGCIGSATVAYLLDHGVDRVVGFSRRRDLGRIDPQYHDRLDFIEGDITDAAQVADAMAQARPSRIIHLAAFQTPDCLANPLGGMEVNVTGTRNMFQAAAALGSDLKRFVFASSAAVYGPREIYDSPTVTNSAPFAPRNLYGFWKVAGEGMAQAFQAETGVASVSIRLATCYGPGRDLGMTSAPTAALKCIAAGESFRIPYQGREHYHFVADVGAGFAEAAIADFDGYGAYNLRGVTVPTSEFLETARQIAGELGIDQVDVEIAEDADSMPFVNDLDQSETVEVFPNMPITPLEEGIRISLEKFHEMAQAGELVAEYRQGG